MSSIVAMFIFTGALGSAGVLLSHSVIALALHNTIILIINHKSVFQRLNQHSTQVRSIQRAQVSITDTRGEG